MAVFRDRHDAAEQAGISRTRAAQLLSLQAQAAHSTPEGAVAVTMLAEHARRTVSDGVDPQAVADLLGVTVEQLTGTLDLLAQ
jgi:hypothetical protein